MHKQAVGAPSDLPQMLDEQSLGKTTTILVVEDNPDEARLI